MNEIANSKNPLTWDVFATKRQGATRDPWGMCFAKIPRHLGVFIMKYRNEAPSVKLSTVATFPNHYFLENLAVRSDNSVLVTVLNHNELWYVPASNDEQPVEPQLLFTFSHPAMGIVEVEPEVFYISASDIYDGKNPTSIVSI